MLGMRPESSKHHDLEAQRERERLRGLGLDPQVINESGDREQLRIKGLTWLRIRMLVLTLMLAKAQVSDKYYA